MCVTKNVVHETQLQRVRVHKNDKSENEIDGDGDLNVVEMSPLLILSY